MKKKTDEQLLEEYGVSKEWFLEFYVEKKWSLPEIKREKKIGYRAIQRLLRAFGIPIRDSKTVANLPHIRERYQKTCMLKYGADNVSKAESIKKKKAETFTKNYGVDNIWKTKAYYEWLEKYMVLNYGSKRTGVAIWPTERHRKQSIFRWANFTPEKREMLIKNILKKLHNSSTVKNSIEVKICQVLDTLNISYRRRYMCQRFIFDFYIPSMGLVIEANGDFWHANPKKYLPMDVLPMPGKHKTAQEIWEKDQKKIDFVKSIGYSMVIMWENEIKSKECASILWERIQNAIKKCD